MATSEFTAERWAAVPGWEGLYDVSDRGNVRSVQREYVSGNGRCAITGGSMRLGTSRAGYKTVTLSKNGVQEKVPVHRLVAIAFIPNPGDKPQVNHIDGDKTNNLAGNLEWVTPSENSVHAVTHGLRPMGSRHWTRLRPECLARGERHGNARFTEEDIAEIRRMAASGISQTVIATAFCTRQGVVSNIVRGWSRRDT